MRVKEKIYERNKILLIGKASYVGSYLFRALQSKKIQTFATDYRHRADYFLDLKNPELSKLDIPFDECSHAIITAAQPNIPICEKDPDLSYQCNVEGPLRICAELKDKSITPVLFSTDYVFDGKLGNYTEESEPSPINVYGKHKAELERRIVELCGDNFLMIRLSKVFGTIKGDHTLIDEMAQNYSREKEVKAAYDQIFCPVFIDDVVNVIIFLMQKEIKGLFHVCGSEVWTRYDLAAKLQEYFPEGKLKKISLDELGWTRPKYTALKNKKLLQILPFPLASVSSCIEVLAKQYS